MCIWDICDSHCFKFSCFKGSLPLSISNPSDLTMGQKLRLWCYRSVSVETYIRFTEWSELMASKNFLAVSGIFLLSSLYHGLFWGEILIKLLTNFVRCKVIVLWRLKCVFIFELTLNLSCLAFLEFLGLSSI